MSLVKMELMIFQSPIFNGPIFNRALSGHDRRRTSGVVKCMGGPIDRDIKKRFWIILRKVEMAMVSYRGSSEPLKSGFPIRFALSGNDAVAFDRFGSLIGLDRS